MTDRISGTTRDSLNLGELREIEVSVPPLPEQRRIVARIEELQARTGRAREALESVPALLERFRQSVLASAFRGDLTADWRESHPGVEPAPVLLERIRAERRRRWEEAELEKMKAKGRAPKDDRWKEKYQEPEPVDTDGLPELPEGWAWARVELLSSAVDAVSYGVVQPGVEAADGIPLVRVCDIEGGQVTTSDLRTISPEIDRQYERTRLRGREVLVTVVGTIGRIAVVPDTLSGANIARAVARIVPSAIIPSQWISFALQSPHLQQWLTREAREVARKTLNIGTLTQTAIPVAPADEMNAIVQLLPTMLGRGQAIEEAIVAISHELAAQDHAILAKAFRGELVPQDAADEPASVLLERIRNERGEQSRRGRGRNSRS
jgi:type I restriction enzyme S subunit